MGERDLLPRRLGGGRRGGHAVPRAAPREPVVAAHGPAVRHRRSRVGRLHRRGAGAAAGPRRFRRPRLPLRHQSPLLPLRAHRRQGGAAGRAPTAGDDVPRCRLAGACPRALPVRHEGLPRAARRERRAAHPRLRRRRARPRGLRRRAPEGQGGAGGQRARAIPVVRGQHVPAGARGDRPAHRRPGDGAGAPARGQPAPEAMEEVRHVRLRGRAQRPLRRSRRRRRPRHADRAERAAHPGRHLRSHQRADRGRPGSTHRTRRRRRAACTRPSATRTTTTRTTGPTCPCRAGSRPARPRSTERPISPRPRSAGTGPPSGRR
jgi:hypothetical protein